MKNILFALAVLCFAISSCKNNEPESIPMPPATAAICEPPSYQGKMKVAVIIYDGVEVVDMNGPIDVFTKANYIKDHYYVYTVAAKDTIIYTENCNTAIIPRYTFKNCPSPDIVILPGVANAEKILADSSFNNAIVPWIKEMAADPEKDIMSVCTGGVLLGKTGLLDNKTATTHYLALDLMKTLYPKVNVVGGVRFVDAGKIITTAGITSGIDGALHLVEKYEGKVTADSVAHLLVYNRDCPMRGPSN
jgi:transcriptional regulator GlxA family with amidase domain